VTRLDSPVPPPPRRRPIPSTPAYRPKVAGLNKQRSADAAERATPSTVDDTSAAAPDGGGVTADHSDSGSRASTTSTADVVDETPDTSREGARGTADRGSLASAKAAELDTDDVPTAAVDAVDLGDTEVAEGPDAPVKPVGRAKRKSTAVPSPVPGTADAEEADTESDSADTADSADDGADSADEAAGAGRTRSPLLLPLVLLLVAAALAGLGHWFQTRDRDVRVNQALVDTGGTTEVSGQAREAVEKAFSYNFADVAATESAANELLVGKAKCQYNAIFGPVKSLAPEQKLVVTVRVVSSGVTSLDGDRATVLLFIDQVTTRTTDNTTGGGIAMMRVGTRRTDGRWKVDNMEMFGQTGDQSAEMAKCSDAG
jgi:Mce-associated membrane protein